MLAIASLAAGVVTALITPPPQASAVPLPLGGAAGLLQEDGLGPVLHQAAEGAGDALRTTGSGGLI
ncbi:hypothetical protein BU197_07785 [Streptomyces sp. CBMA291]|nr:hypothetical protein [Streptomyces sp. CBMA291]MBD0712660.1 hypothetical protein [Streptomyces sp. CBMA370]